MKDFMLLFRQPDYGLSNISPEEMKALAKKWKEWEKGIAEQGKFGNLGGRLGTQGKVLKKGGVVTDGPFVEIKEKLGGFVTVKAENLEEAITLAHGCPVLEVNGSVEVRPLGI